MTDTVEVKEGFCTLPNEMVIYVLSLVDEDSLLTCRLVTRSWRYLIDKFVFQDKASKENALVNNGQGFYSFSNIGSNSIKRLDLPWYVFYTICKYDPFNRNLVKNHCGQNNFDHWSTLERNQGWAIENRPEGAPMLPDDPDFDGQTSCFVSTYRLCAKKQNIEFKKHGITKKLMQYLKPDIFVSEWFSGRFDCGCKYSLEATVYDDKNCILEQHNYQKTLHQWQADSWTKISHTFRSLNNPYRIILLHSGVDTQFWAGYYGTKISGSVVKVLLPLKLKPII
ncbi:F-box only protein 6-like [Adelges cooleyi]|uniref:F-box only protein 6-like n=1 Tax=Adelges cooleyi TaxID=133065 RepID=UPI00217F6ADD|nr:F-box only protein 6-like [Adelges cooleyi]